jgi:Secretion system C-terminal sorting domain
VLGETELSRNLLQQDLGVNIRSFRSGYLCNNRDLVRGLDTVGYTYNSTYSANDVLTNFPYRDHKFRNYRGPMSKIWELPMTLSDVFASNKITQDNYLQKEAIWINVVNKNMANYAPTIILIHPTRYYKLFAEQLLINQLDPRVAIVNFENYADYWVERDSLRFTTTLQSGVLTILVAHSQVPLLTMGSEISFVVDNGQGLTSIVAKDSLTGTLIPTMQSNWDNNGTLVHFGIYNTGINVNGGVGASDITVNCFPNPFDNSTTIEVWQKETSQLNITIYNVYGQLIKNITNEKRDAGIYRETFNAEGIAAGTYFCKITTGNKTVVKKLMITN